MGYLESIAVYETLTGLRLRTRTTNARGSCPFHHGRDPNAFSITATGSAKCFSCQASCTNTRALFLALTMGDATVPCTREALHAWRQYEQDHQLQERAVAPLPSVQMPGLEVRQFLSKVLHWAHLEFYHDIEAQRYWKQRGLNVSMQRFAAYFPHAPSRVNALFAQMRLWAGGHFWEWGQAAGLLSSNGRLAVTNRLAFCFFDAQQLPLYYVARWVPNPQLFMPAAKYLNPRGWPQPLIALHGTQTGWHFTEGPVDALTLNQVGCNAIPLFGAANAQRLKNLHLNGPFYVWQDPNPAGERFVRLVADMLLPSRVTVLQSPSGDVNDWLHTNPTDFRYYLRRYAA